MLGDDAMKRAALLLLVGPCLVGCGVQLSTVARTDGRTPATLRASSDRALVVFVGKSFRSTSTGEANNGVRVADDRGRIVGELGPGNWMTAEAETGRRCWYAWHDIYGGSPTVAAACGDFVAGRTYFVRVGQRNDHELGGTLQPTWQPGTLFDREQEPRMGRVYDPALARETEQRFAGRIAEAVRKGAARVAAGDFVVLGHPAAYD